MWWSCEGSMMMKYVTLSNWLGIGQSMYASLNTCHLMAMYGRMTSWCLTETCSEQFKADFQRALIAGKWVPFDLKIASTIQVPFPCVYSRLQCMALQESCRFRTYLPVLRLRTYFHAEAIQFTLPISTGHLIAFSLVFLPGTRFSLGVAMAKLT